MSRVYVTSGMIAVISDSPKIGRRIANAAMLGIVYRMPAVVSTGA